MGMRLLAFPAEPTPGLLTRAGALMGPGGIVGGLVTIAREVAINTNRD